MNYTVLNTIQGDATYDISQMVVSIKWGGDIRQAARKLDISMAFGRDYYLQLKKYSVPLGSLLTLKGDAGEIIRAVVFDSQKDTGGGYSITSHDHLIYLLKSTGTYIFRKTTPEAIAGKLCSDFKIPVGSLASTGITLDKLILRDMSIFDMALVAYTEAMKRNGKKYYFRMREGKLHVIEKAQQTVRWLITEGANLSAASYSENINDMRNRVLIVGDNDKVLAQVEDAELIRLYGLLQELQQEDNIKSGEAMTMAKNLLKDLGRVSREASITCLGLDDVEAGTAIEVKESITGLTGTYYVDTDEHTVTNGQHLMTLKLNWTDEVATKDAPEVQK